MKTPRPLQAFTLIELITVIAIISILMALLFPAIAAAKEGARRQAAGAAVRDIKNACTAYYNDYGKFPPIKEAEDGDPKKNAYMSFGDTKDGKCKIENQELFDILRAISRGKNQDHIYNKRQQKYIAQSKAKDPKTPRDGFCDGQEFPSEKQGQLLDPWGTQYTVVLETDGNEELDLSTFYTDLAGADNVIRTTVVALSMGKDGKLGGKGYEEKFRKEKSAEAPDDIVSWQ